MLFDAQVGELLGKVDRIKPSAIVAAMAKITVMVFIVINRCRGMFVFVIW
ncbi:hypothetical protein SELR_pSRC201030 (plasmid) [Selenomonas ruminantium subsp. lactilytica TAM6421]|uniref:Uncharacterized protein n=1 Tax=Selenomonas ruminantium subsp. lactilytica (strain NBRC 103574 / TAM6421) TaxID=927704 RepID=I0GV50_SELRL|nr:hypothetical protein SELR_pSRC201030 [Selenomonas ruminantium subsp. lactilytica TAM6421]